VWQKGKDPVGSFERQKKVRRELGSPRGSVLRKITAIGDFKKARPSKKGRWSGQTWSPVIRVTEEGNQTHTSKGKPRKSEGRGPLVTRRLAKEEPSREKRNAFHTSEGRPGSRTRPTSPRTRQQTKKKKKKKQEEKSGVPQKV